MTNDSSWVRRAVALAVVAMLAACASPSAYRTPNVAVPVQWQQQQASSASAPTSTQAVVAERWWERFGDTQLTQLVDEALQRNNNLAVAALKVRRAQLQAGLAASAQLPSISLGANTSASRLLERGPTTRSTGVTAGVSWEADLWGRLAAQRNMADWEAQATEEDRAAAALSLVGTTANLYWQVAYLNQRIESGQQSIDYARKTLELVKVQHVAGSVTGLEEAQAQQTLASQEASQSQLVQQRVEARNALAILFDKPPSQTLGEVQRLPDIALPAVEAGLPASVLARRPDLRAAELRLRSSLAKVDATRTSYYPTLSLTGSLGSTSNALSNVLNNPLATLGAGLALPFIQWRDMQRNVAVSQADYEQAVLGFRQTWYQALADVENALSARTQLEVQARQLQLSLTAALQSERLSEIQYRAGAVSLKTWLDAQETRRVATNNLAQNRLNRLTNLVTLYQVLGG
ncbi:efflux transporter outer membrane subunit [Aquabacterium sp. CECT 9606]|uniref:efflux transporter outer membrane subunit n=1 Tax=Aquabacterium sp. CECT 9606 TaxID=2845822 RepID=UPI001E54B14A|nr:efflux transporter outer membrane subunit [Aquabacterium sp. CECT 9606]CAH0350052.1 Toxin and drug export protein A [Aquabacterium sp. CECT 9606]